MFVVVGLLGWWSLKRLGWVLAAVLWWVQIGVARVVGFWLRFCGGFVVGFGYGLCHGFFFFGGWGLRLWLVVAAVAVAVTVVRGDELEKLRPWRF